ncbi:hypothetical protein CDAR_40121 [Caerostris darwini]|uniref:Secreted protein n=1 Tax=Caerostris darwini TaxID=1538125 RepID=A0AAV4RDN0_9ARAC|nr:hypothetical protein CDAR_40121 [Caerostris darwini]
MIFALLCVYAPRVQEVLASYFMHGQHAKVVKCMREHRPCTGGGQRNLLYLQMKDTLVAFHSLHCECDKYNMKAEKYATGRGRLKRRC